jgi:hypothetical protein
MTGRAGPLLADGPDPAGVPALPLDGALWTGVDRLLDRAPSPADVRAHKLELLALERWRATGREVPSEFTALHRRTAAATLAMPMLLEGIRAVLDGPVMLVKGPEVAARYPRPGLRAYGDLDLLVEDPVGAQRALLESGFSLVGDERLYRDIHHVRPVHYPKMPVVVELHARVKWLDGLQAPPTADLLERGVPAAARVSGLVALPPAEHAVVIAVHSWAHQPLRRLGDLIDVAAAVQGAVADEARSVAADWGVERLWHATEGALAFLVGGGRRPWPLHSWARNLPAVRDRSVLERHVERWLSGYSVYPAAAATRRALAAVAADIRPEDDEGWSAKARRTRTALRNAFVGRTRHDEELRKRGNGDGDRS